MSLSTSQFLIEHIWQSTLFGLAVACMIFALRNGSASSRYFLAWSAMIKFLIPIQAFVWVFQSGVDLIPKKIFTAETSELLRPLAIPPGFDTNREFSNLFSATQMSPQFLSSNLHIEPFISICILGTLTLTAFWLLRYTYSCFHIRRYCKPADVSYRTAAERLWKKRNQLMPRILLSESDSLLIGVFGFFRQAIIFPKELIATLTTDERDQLLFHELAHAERQDTIWLLFQKRIRDLFWFHPLVWWFDHQVSLNREILRDEEVLNQTRDKRAYLNCLMKVSMITPAGCSFSSVGLRGSSFSKRVRAIARFRRSPKRDLVSFAASIFIISASTAMLALSTSATYPKAKIISVSTEIPIHHPVSQKKAQLDAFEKEYGTALEALFEQSILRIENAPRSHKLEFGENSFTKEESNVVRQAIALVQKQRHDEAFDLIESHLDENSSPKMLHFAANLYVDRGDPKAAIRNYSLAQQKLYRPTLRITKTMGYSLVKEQRYTDALPYLKEALHLSKELDDTIHGLLALSYLNNRDLIAAEHHFKEASKLSPETKDWSIGLAKTYLLQEKHKEAIALMKSINSRFASTNTQLISQG